MHIVQALVSLNLGGSELVAVELAEHAAALGHRVTVIAAPGPLSARLADSGAQLLEWPIGRKRPRTLRYIGRLADWMRDERPDVLHAHSRLPAWICHFALRRIDPGERPAWITSVHGHYSVNRYSAVMAGGDRVIAVSDHIREYTLRNYPSVDPGRITTVHGGVSRRTFPTGYRPAASWTAAAHETFPELRGKRLVCLPGRLSRYKGHADFIELIAGLVKTVPEVHGVVVGKARRGSRYRDELEGLAERYGVLNRVSFVGARTDMRDWMASSEIVYSLCADPPEAFGRTVPEALHLGVPVIGWDHGGVAETLAVLFPQGAVRPGDRAGLLQRSIDFLKHRPVVAPGSAFGLSESMNKTMAVYESAVQERTP